jgi:hypothetical protein
MTRYLIPPSPPEDLDLPSSPSPQDLDIPDEAYGARTAFSWLVPGETLDPAYRQEADRANATRAMELQNQFLDRQRAILSTGPDAFFDRRGREAVLGANDVLSRLQDARAEMLDQTANAAQRRLLQAALDRHALVEHGDIGEHVGRQSLQWQNEVATGRLDHLRHQTALDHGDPGAIGAYATASESAARERARTLNIAPDSAEAFQEVEGARSSIWRIAIEVALGKWHFPQAIILYNSAGGGLTRDDAQALAPQIDAARQHQAGQDYLARLGLPDSRDLAELDAAHQAATAQNDSDWPDDDSQRATNQHFIDVAFGQKKRAALEAKAGLHQAVNDWLDQSGADGTPQTERPPLALWTQLDPKEQQAVDRVLLWNARGEDPDSERAGPPTSDDAPPEAGPEESDPEESDPEESDPEESDPEESDPEKSDPEESDPEESDPEESGPEEPDLPSSPRQEVPNEDAPDPETDPRIVHREDGTATVTVGKVPTPDGPAGATVEIDRDRRGATAEMALPDGRRLQSRWTGPDGRHWSQIDTIRDPHGALGGTQTTTFDGRRYTRTWEPTDGPPQTMHHDIEEAAGDLIRANGMVGVLGRPGLPAAGALAGRVLALGARALGIAPGVAGAGAVAAGTVLLWPWSSQGATFDLGEGLRLRVPPGSFDGVVEKHVLGGTLWDDLRVAVRTVDGKGDRQILMIDAAALEQAIGPEAAARVLERAEEFFDVYRSTSTSRRARRPALATLVNGGRMTNARRPQRVARLRRRPKNLVWASTNFSPNG